MPTTYKVLGQVNPSATTATTVYTVPSATSTIVSSIVVANLGGSSASYRISVRPAGETQANKHYLVYDATIAATDSLTLTLGITLATTDVVTVFASSATMSFSLFGSEIS
jgi:glucose-6-phosphate dehydrogenase assembly protein OpcA